MSSRRARLRRKETAVEAAEAPPPGLGLPLGLAFALSGVAGLVYELTWTRYLALLVGHSAFAQVLVLAVYLGGTALGSLLVAERSRTLRQPLWGYALVEAVLGVLGIVFHFLYRAGEGLLYGLVLPRFAEGGGGAAIWTVAVLLILPQALLLGTTFPLMAAGVVRRRRGAPGRSVADVYLLNTLGGALGVLIGGFLLVPSLGLPGAAAAAGVLNLVAAALAYRAGRTEQPEAVMPGTTMGVGPAVRASVPLLLAATLFSALASFVYEIGWIRMLSLVLGSATHSFDLMLSAFLFGLGFGSLLIRRRADRAESPVRLLGAVQWTMGVAALLTLPIFAESFEVMAWLVRTVPKTESGYLIFNLSRYALALVVMLPATLLAGMTLPLITATLLRAGAGERVIGQAYAANTLGSMIGAVGGGLVLMSRLGLERLLALGAAVDIAVGVALLVMAAESARRRLRVGALAAGVGALLVGGTVWLVRFDQTLLTSGVYRSGQIPEPGAREVLFYKDGATATIGAHRLPNGQTVITTNGKGDASLPLRWLRQASGEYLPPFPMSGEGDETTQVLAPLITLAHRPDAKRVLVVGQGSGMSTQILLGDPVIEELITVEIEPEMIVGSSVFMPANRRSFEDPRGRFLLEDARRAVVQGDPLDIILSEPSNPWISGVASLFTVEFYERARNRLSEGGVFGQWVHLYEIEDELILTILAAIDRTFPEWTAYLTSAADMLVVAGKDSLSAPDWRVAEFPGIQQDLAHAPQLTPGVFESLFLFDHRTMRPLLRRTQANTDARPLLDTRAERARFLGGGAAGLFSFADHPVNLSRILSRSYFSPIPYDPPPIIGIAPVERRALAAWLLVAGHSGEPPPFEWWDPAVSGLATFEAGLRAGPPADWRQWFDQFTLVEGVLHGRATGWADTTLYGAVEDYLSEHDAPPAVRGSIALLKGLRVLDLPAAAAAADALRVTDPAVPQLLPPGVLVDAAVAAYLGAEEPGKARAVFDARSQQTGRPPDDVRNRVLDALIDAALGDE